MLWVAAVWASYIFFWVLGISIVIALLVAAIAWIVDTWRYDREECIGVVGGFILTCLIIIALAIILIDKDYKESHFIDIKVVEKEE